MNRLEKDVAAYEKVFPFLIDDYEGKYALIHDGTFWGVFDEEMEAARVAYGMFRYVDLLVQNIAWLEECIVARPY